MAILGLQGIRGGVGTTSIAAALAWSLQLLGENVLVIDTSPDNLLRLSFNVDFSHRDGWARAMLDGRDWQDGGMRYTSQLDLLPFGQLTAQEREYPDRWLEQLGGIAAGIRALKESGRYSLSSDSDVWIKLRTRKQPGIHENKREEVLSCEASHSNGLFDELKIRQIVNIRSSDSNNSFVSYRFGSHCG